MAKIGVYIPDDRMKDINRWRDKMNFSQLFLEAFDRAVATNAAISKVKEKEMKEVIERLKREAGAAFEAGWKQGASQGREWAIKHAHFSDLRKIGEGELKFDGPEDEANRFLRIAYEFAGYIKTPQDEWEERDLSSDHATHNRGFNQGFTEAAKQVWENIKHAF